ncbi:cytochrome P450 [Daedalea quercina L-15889]|uniref:Cytochrome P450 n=1 Tax=Daedalea quercina L-15889 TaxID=1314783 RepID=A0A165N4Q3_9APHY|nr:cytochrome P450 [Daedalea quercina L-15889]
MSFSINVAHFLLGSVLLGFVAALRHRRPSSTPPGPAAWPLVGNLWDLPSSHPWITFAQWSARWGNIMQISLLGQPLVIVGSRQAAVDMLERKTSMYSDRPRSTLGRLVGWVRLTALLPFGPRWRETRRLFTPALGSRASVVAFEPIMNVQISRFLPRIMKSPDQIADQVLRTVAGTTLMILYGYNLHEDDSSFVDIARAAMPEFSAGFMPGAYLVDLLPILQYVPSWIPGMEWKKLAKTWKRDTNAVLDVPYEFTKQEMAKGSKFPSFVSLCLGESPDAEREELVKTAATSLYIGAVDSTTSTVTTFFHVMAKYPEVQKRAQTEIDRVIGHNRLPLLQDRHQLPYVDAIVSEILRWKPAVPLGMPHRLQQDDVHEGFYLREGTIVVANIWQMLRDPDTYSQPEMFNPERFMSSEKHVAEMDPRKIIWGFGRRSCPGTSYVYYQELCLFQALIEPLSGLYLADTCIFLAIAQILATFNITTSEERDICDVDYTTGIISHPGPFECTAAPRSAKAEALINSVGLD